MRKPCADYLSEDRIDRQRPTETTKVNRSPWPRLKGEPGYGLTAKPILRVGIQDGKIAVDELKRLLNR